MVLVGKMVHDGPIPSLTMLWDACVWVLEVINGNGLAAIMIWHQLRTYLLHLLCHPLPYFIFYMMLSLILLIVFNIIDYKCIMIDCAC